MVTGSGTGSACVILGPFDILRRVEVPPQARSVGHRRGRRGGDRGRPDEARAAVSIAVGDMSLLTAPISVVEMLLNQAERVPSGVCRGRQIHGELFSQHGHGAVDRALPVSKKNGSSGARRRRRGTSGAGQRKRAFPPLVVAWAHARTVALSAAGHAPRPASRHPGPPGLQASWAAAVPPGFLLARLLGREVAPQLV